MATTRALDIEIRAQTTGQETVAQLTQRLDDMAVLLSGDLQSQAQAAAEKLRELARQQAAIDEFKQLEGGVRSTSRALNAAEKELSDYTAQITKMGPPTAVQAQALQKMSDAVSNTKAELDKQKEALAGAVGKLSDYGIASGSVVQAQKRIAEQTDQVRDSVKNIAPAYAAAANGASNAADKQVQSNKRVNDSIDLIDQNLNELRGQIVAVFGVQAGAELLKDLAKAADAYNSLSARIKLVTGDGQAFKSAFEDVQKVAIATRSDLEATGTLFARIADAGKQMGVSQRQALAITQSINEAIQISGASAQASDAAITQLIQGLQGGALRGEEFNSVMEQAPRLAKALADGLNVPISNLRLLAEQGQLTSEVVINALKSQSQTLAKEFATLPPTVGGALKNLSTAWTVYIGEVDNANGVSRKAAEAITFLSTHLKDIGDVALTTGKGVAALVALDLAKRFGAWAVASREVAAATTTMAAATTSAAAADTAAAAAATRLGAAKAQAATSVGLMTAAMAGVRTASAGVLSLLGGPAGLLVLTATYAKDIGELAAKLVLKAKGMKNAEEAAIELAKADKEAYEKAVALKEAFDAKAKAAQEARDASFKLSDGAKKLIFDFDELTKKGESAAEAIGKIGQDFDLGTLKGVNDAIGALDKLAAAGKITGDQVKEALSKALDDKDLLKFEVLAKASFMGTAREAERTAMVMDATLRKAIQRTGLDFDQIKGGMSRATVSALNDLDTIVKGMGSLKLSSKDAGDVIKASIEKALDGAKSKAELDALKDRVIALKDKLKPDDAKTLLDQIAEKTKLATGELDKVAAAFERLGIKTVEQSKKAAQQMEADYNTVAASGKASAKDLEQKWIEMTTAQINASGGMVTEFQRAEAAAKGLEISVDSSGNVAIKKFDEAAQKARELAKSVKDAAEEANKFQKTMQTAAQWDASLKRDSDKFSIDEKGQRIGMSVQTPESIRRQLIEQGVDEAQAASMADKLARQWQGMALGSGGRLSGTFTQMTNTQSWDAIMQEAVQSARNGLGGTPTRTVNVNLNQGGRRVTATVPEGDEQRFLGMLDAARRVSS